MRIRQVKPELFTDSVTARFSAEAFRLYIGLWCMSDDAGFFVWDVDQIGASLYAYQSPKARCGRINKAAAEIVEAGRMEVLECGHAVIPTMPKHQRISESKRVLTEANKHRSRNCPRLPAPSRDLPHVPDPERNGSGTVGNGKERNENAGARADEARDPRHIPLRFIDGEWVHLEGAA